MTDTKKQPAKFYANGDTKGREVVTMADLRAAVWRVTNEYTRVLRVSGGLVHQRDKQVGRLVGEVSGD